jgi:hypothetical protein
LIRVRADGKVELRTSSNAAEFFVGQDSTGTVLQTGGTVKSDNTVRIGSEPGGVGQYTISAGTLNTASDGSGTFTIGRNGGSGTLRVEGTGQVTHGAELLIGDIANANTSGRLELVGNTASMQIGQLENAVGGTAGVRETMFWQAAATGVMPLVVTGAGPLASNRVQLQDPTELAANTGTNGGGNLTGDGTALELDLSAITTNMVLTLIDNRTTDAITGFFEKGTTKNLYEEGEVILDTGFAGTVTVSYHGGTGNDVTLNLVTLLGDYNHDGDVNAADYVGWRKTDANNQQNYVNWRANFGQLAPSLGSPFSGDVLSAQVPEPTMLAFLVMALISLSVGRGRKHN